MIFSLSRLLWRILMVLVFRDFPASPCKPRGICSAIRSGGASPFWGSATKQKCCPLIRVTAVTGIVRPRLAAPDDPGPYELLHAQRRRCFVQPALHEHGLRRVVHAGATKVIGLVATILPSASSSCTGSPTRRSGERSSGTWIYGLERVGLLSIVVITVEVVTRSPTRIVMSPTTPACGAFTR